MIYLISVLILWCYYFINRLSKKTEVPYIFRWFLTVAFSMWYVIPIALSVLGYWNIFESTAGISLDDYLIFASLELVFFLIILTVSYYTYRIKIPMSISIEDNIRVKNITFWFIVTMFIISLLSSLSQMNYDTNNELSNAEGALKILGVFTGYVVSFFWCIIIFSSKLFSPRKLVILLMLLSILIAILSGGRIYILCVIWLYIFVFKFLLERKKYIKFVMPIFILLILSSILLPILAAKRTKTEAPLLENSQVIADMTLLHLNLKLNSIAYSTVLITNDGVGFAGGTPYLGSMFKFIPRFLWFEKPTPTSYNNDISGTPARRIPLLYGSKDETANVGVSPFSVALWQGYFFIFLSLMMNIVYIRILILFLKHSSIYIKALGFNMFYFPQLIMVPSYGDNIIQKLIECIVLLSVLYIFGIIKLKKRYEDCYISRRIR